MFRLKRAFPALTLICFMTPIVSAQLPELNSATFNAYRLAIEPSESEVAYLQIDWYSQLRRAVRQADRSEKPLLIYMMNGHPLACT